MFCGLYGKPADEQDEFFVFIITRLIKEDDKRP